MFIYFICCFQENCCMVFRQGGHAGERVERGRVQAGWISNDEHGPERGNTQIGREGKLCSS